VEAWEEEVSKVLNLHKERKAMLLVAETAQVELSHLRWVDLLQAMANKDEAVKSDTLNRFSKHFVRLKIKFANILLFIMRNYSI
jgi:hypothetical protein